MSLSFHEPVSVFKKCVINPIKTRNTIKPKNISIDHIKTNKIHSHNHKNQMVFTPKPSHQIHITIDYDKETEKLFEQPIKTEANDQSILFSHRQQISKLKLRLNNNNKTVNHPQQLKSDNNLTLNQIKVTNQSLLNLSTIKSIRQKKSNNSPSNVKKQKIRIFHLQSKTMLPPISPKKKPSTSYYTFSFLSQCGYYYEQKSEKINQDRVLVAHNILDINNYSVFGIFDGHGQNGHYISELCKNFYKKYYSDSFLYYISRLSPTEPLSSLSNYISSSDIFRKLSNDNYSLIQNSIKEISKLIKSSEYEIDFSGTTMNQIIIADKKLISINIGDSRAIMIKRNGTISLSKDHKPSDPTERNRIESLGGEIKRSSNSIGPLRIWIKGKEYPGIAMSRSLGDLVSKEIGVIGEADINVYDIDNTCLGVVVASDGVWDNMSNEEVREIFIKGNEESKIAEEIEEKSRGRYINRKENVDDISIIVIKFNQF